MAIDFERHLPIKGTFNIRDLGGYETTDGVTRWRRLLRADGLHKLQPDGVDQLVSHGVVTVIDLRHASELEHQPNPFAERDGVDYHNVSLFENLAPPTPENMPKDDIDVLHELYVMALKERHDAILKILQIIADAPEGTVLFHCTAGKDRTGIIAALTLGLAGVDHETIVKDYALTEIMIAPIVDEIIAAVVARGGNAERMRPLLASKPETMQATLDHILENHGSIEAYLKDIGLDDGVKDRIRARLAG